MQHAAPLCRPGGMISTALALALVTHREPWVCANIRTTIQCDHAGGAASVNDSVGGL